MFADDDEGMPFFGADGALVTPGAEPLTAEGAEALAVRAGFAPVVIIRVTVEDMIGTTQDMEIPRAEWDAMTPAQRNARIDEFGAETMNNCGGYGASILSGAPDSDLVETPAPLTVERDCTHGDGCPVHPDTHAVHNFDGPEYAAYAAELKTELGKFARGEDPYPFTDVETPEQRVARHALDKPLIEAFRAMIPNPHPLENCGPLALRLKPGESCPTCGTVPVEPITAPTLADDVAALRANIIDVWDMTGHLLGSTDIDSRAAMLARFDRIAGAVPQRATGPLARPLWQHGCGRIASGPGCTGPACRSCGEVGGWLALYVIEDGV